MGDWSRTLRRMLLRAYAAAPAVLLPAPGLALGLGLRGAGDRRGRRRGRVHARHAVAARLLAQEAAEVGRPPRQRRPARRVPVVVVAVVEVLALEVAVAARRAGLEAHRVLEGVAAVPAVVAVRSRRRLHGAERVADLVTHGVGAAEAVALAEDDADRAAHVVAVRGRAPGVLVEGRLAAGAGGRRPVEPDDVVGVALRRRGRRGHG